MCRHLDESSHFRRILVSSMPSALTACDAFHSYSLGWFGNIPGPAKPVGSWSVDCNCCRCLCWTCVRLRRSQEAKRSVPSGRDSQSIEWMRGEENFLGRLHHSRTGRGCRAPAVVGAGGNYSYRLCQLV